MIFKIQPTDVGFLAPIYICHEWFILEIVYFVVQNKMFFLSFCLLLCYWKLQICSDLCWWGKRSYLVIKILLKHKQISFHILNQINIMLAFWLQINHQFQNLFSTLSPTFPPTYVSGNHSKYEKMWSIDHYHSILFP